MLRFNTGVVSGLWAATIVAAFAVGRITTPTEAAGAPEDLGVSVRSALAEPSSLERLARTANLMHYLDAETLPEVVAVYDRMLSGLDECDIRPLVDAWTRFDPSAALDHTLAWRFTKRQKFGVDAVIRGWALRDPFEAQLVSEQVGQEHPSLRDGVFQNLVVGWVQSGQRGLDSYITGLSPVSQDAAAGLVVGGLLRKGGPELTQRWADAILEDHEHSPNFKKTVFRRATRSVARWYPERAAKWVMEHEGESYADHGIRLVAEQWGEQDGPAAMKWLRDRPAGEFRDDAVRDAFARWTKWDREGAERWLLVEELSAFHAPAINLYARRIDSQTPQKAIGWCERIVALDLQYGCLKVTASAWYQKDAVAAESWLQASPLDEEARRVVRTPKSNLDRARGAAGARSGEGPR